MSIEIKLEGDLSLSESEGGHSADTIAIDGEDLAELIREKCGATYTTDEMLLLGPCRLTLHIDLDQNAPDL